MSLFRVFVDGQLFYHPHLSQLSITEAKVQEDAENIDSLTLSAPFNHPYLCLLYTSSTIFLPVMGFSLLSELELFADPKNGNSRNKEPPALRVRVDSYVGKYPAED